MSNIGFIIKNDDSGNAEKDVADVWASNIALVSATATELGFIGSNNKDLARTFVLYSNLGADYKATQAGACNLIDKNGNDIGPMFCKKNTVESKTYNLISSFTYITPVTNANNLNTAIYINRQGSPCIPPINTTHIKIYCVGGGAGGGAGGWASSNYNGRGGGGGGAGQYTYTNNYVPFYRRTNDYIIVGGGGAGGLGGRDNLGKTTSNGKPGYQSIYYSLENSVLTEKQAYGGLGGTAGADNAIGKASAYLAFNNIIQSRTNPSPGSDSLNSGGSAGGAGGNNNTGYGIGGSGGNGKSANKGDYDINPGNAGSSGCVTLVFYEYS